MDLHLGHRVILVTGGAKGIGEAVARTLAAEEAIPVIVGRKRADNEAAVAKITASGGQAWAVEAELTQTDECERAVELTVAKFGRI